MEDLLGDTGLLIPVLARIRVVGVDDNAGVLQPAVGVEGAEMLQILVVVVRHGLAVFIRRASEDCVGERVALALDLPAGVNEGVRVLSRRDGVHHNGEIAACGVFHADGQVKAACGEAVELILDRPCADRNI